MEEVNNYINSIRRDFAKQKLDEESIDKNPFQQFAVWMEEAINSMILDPYAITISSVSADNKPSSRVVYLRGFDEKGFLFYTNYTSKKAADLEQNPNIAINICWIELERQIRINGIVEKLSASESDAYFASRPRESQLGAWTSAQSKPLESRAELEKIYSEIVKKFEGKVVPRPDYWGGYRVVPDYFEFWQGRPNRLHDRISFSLQSSKWILQRLFP
jgi:pyridoxamine 5'-phosphate oxidase